MVSDLTTEPVQYWDCAKATYWRSPSSSGGNCSTVALENESITMMSTGTKRKRMSSTTRPKVIQRSAVLIATCAVLMNPT